MTTHTITDIVTRLDELGRLIQISFRATSANEKGEISADTTLAGTFPLPTAGYVQVQDGNVTYSTDVLQAYTPEEIMGLCRQITEDRAIFYHLDAKLQTQSTPTYVPPVVVQMGDAERRINWVMQVDSSVASVVGKFTRFQLEYEQREKAANTYKAAGYTGDATTWVTRFADNTGISYRAATDLILLQAAQLRDALKKLGNLRMDKYLINKAATIVDAEAAYNKIMAGVAAVEKSLL